MSTDSHDSTEDLFRRIRGAKNEDKFWDLHKNADWEEHCEDRDSADLSHICIVAFYSRFDVHLMDQCFKKSALHRPAKWEGEYRYKTLKKAVDLQYNSKEGERIHGPEENIETKYDYAQRVLEEFRP